MYKLVLETQPRSGTHYLIDNIRRCTGWGYATIFNKELKSEDRFYDDKLRIFYNPHTSLSGDYLVKSHFFQRVRIPGAKYLYLISYPLDSIWLWGRMEKKESYDFVFTADDKVWKEKIQKRVENNVIWMVSLPLDRVFRYEDFLLDFENSRQRLEDFLNFPLDQFQPPEHRPRPFYRNNPGGRLAPELLSHLKEVYGPAIRRLYPEKWDA